MRRLSDLMSRDGISTTQRVKDFKLFEDRESTHAFRVPDRLSRIAFGLTAKVQKHEIERYLTLGAIGVIRKPFNAMTLPDEIRRMVQGG